MNVEIDVNGKWIQEEKEIDMENLNLNRSAAASSVANFDLIDQNESSLD